MADKTLGLSLIIGAALGGGFNKAFRSAEDRVAALGKTAGKLALGKQLAGEIGKLETKLGDLKRRQKEAGAGADDLAREIRDVENALRGATEKARKHGLEIGDAGQAYRRFGAQLDKTQAKIGRIQRAQAASAKRAQLYGRAMPLIGAVYGGARLAGQAMGLEEQRIHLRNVITPVSGSKAAAAARASAHARSASRTSLAGESELLEIMYQLSSGGLDEQQARVGSVVAANVAKVTRGSGEQAAIVMTQIANTLGGEMERIGDVLTQTQFRFSISDFGQLGEGMAEAASGALAAKLPLEQTAAAIGMLNTAGRTGSSASVRRRQNCDTLTLELRQRALGAGVQVAGLAGRGSRVERPALSGRAKRRRPYSSSVSAWAEAAASRALCSRAFLSAALCIRYAIGLLSGSSGRGLPSR